MTIETLFVSSVQSEFTEERRAIKTFVEGDPLLGRFFNVFLFEELPARDRKARQIYLSQVDHCGVYVALLGREYGFLGRKGKSPTEMEYDRATREHKTRFVFIKGEDPLPRDPRLSRLIDKASRQVVWRRFSETPTLIRALYTSLIQLLVDRGTIRTAPFDAAPCAKAAFGDLDSGKIAAFVRRARQERGFPLSEKAAPQEVLTHLNLLDGGRPTHAAILLFGRQPQRFLISSEVKCAHFHGVEEVKPIPSYHVYTGTVFEMVDQTVDFVMAKINRAVGTRRLSVSAPVEYEIPLEVVREAVVNAVAHRDYSSAGSVQVMLFSNRLEIWNPGRLPSSLNVAMLKKPHGSVPGNPLLAESLYLAKYIERMGTGTRDMIRLCRTAGLPEPQFYVRDGFVFRLNRRPDRAIETVTRVSGDRVPPPQEPSKIPAGTPQVVKILKSIARSPLSREKIQRAAGIRDREHFRTTYLKPLLSAQWIEPTFPDKPTSGRQQYRLTKKGKSFLSREEA